jgi:hypothetical protein
MRPFEAELDRDPELALDLARASTEPHAGDRSRNWTALRDRLGLPLSATGTGAPAESASGASASGNDAAHATNGAARSGIAAARAGGLALWQKLLAAGVIAGAAGFVLGKRLDVAPEPQPAPATSTAASVAGARPSSLPQTLEPTPTAPAGVLAPASPSAPEPEVPRARRGVRPASPVAPARPTPDFAAALQLLTRARGALDRDEPALALRLLDELDASFPRELLDQERGATRVLGLCANGEQARAVQLARQLFAGRPRSIYSHRLERSCAGEALGVKP